ncbi:hypothetical protein OH76DRAFT_1483880 [Lentinus brumalis]|uniref:Uncharacterized protein n=1 Tax=Lentinus brumalis TaxID=2498619 RepID=A0A371D7K7_9APHY|nr:hypothetical protein OH76DRAFT_1483880 [Polyporus brumalis]
MGQTQSAPHAPQQQQNGYMPQQHARPPPSSGQYAQQQQYLAGTAHAGPSQASRPAMQPLRPPSAHQKQTSQPGIVHSQQGPYPLASAQSRSAPQANVSLAPVQPPPPQQTQATGSQQSSQNALPTPPPTAHPGGGGARMLTIQEASNMVAYNALQPLRSSLAESLTAAHNRFADEYSRLHSLLVNSEGRFQAVLAKCSSLQQDCARLTVERDAAIKVAQQFKKDKESAIEEMQKMNVNLPKLLIEYFELKSDHALLQQEMATVKEENAQLREKAQANPTPIYTYEPVFSAPASPVEQKVKLEKSPLIVKRERPSAPESPSSDPDAAFAVELAQQHEQRKRKQRDIDELQDLLRQTEAFSDLPMLPLMQSTSYLPPTPTSPLPHSFPANHIPAASSSEAPANPNGNQPDASSVAVKPEQCEAKLHFGIPDLDNANISGELDIIDLTEADSSPMQLTSDLPPLSRRAQADVDSVRKHVLPTEEEDESEQPNKRQRTDDGELATRPEPVDADMKIDDAQPAGSVDVVVPSFADVKQPVGVSGAALTPSSSSAEPATNQRSATLRISTGVDAAVRPMSDVKPEPNPHVEPRTESAAPAGASLLPLTVSPASIEPTPLPSAAARPIVVIPAVPAPSAATVPGTPQPTQTQSPIAASPSIVSLPSSSSAPQHPPRVVVRALPAKGLGVAHIPLMYDNVRNKLYCRVCVARSKNFNTPVTTLPEDADWPTLRGHYEKEHPASCERLVVMTPEQIRTKKAENDSKKVPFPFVTKKRKSAP